MLRQVKTENGWVRGIEAADPRITAFKGIPFAAPPIGKNRWRAPQPCGNWAGVRDASRFAPISMQWIPGLSDDIYVREWHVDPEIPMGEADVVVADRLGPRALLAELDPAKYIGRSASQVEEFLSQVVKPVLDRYAGDELTAQLNI